MLSSYLISASRGPNILHHGSPDYVPPAQGKGFNKIIDISAELTLLAQWLDGNASNAKCVLGGSATPGLSMDDLVALSSDRRKTEDAFKFSSLQLVTHSAQGSLALRQSIAEMYNEKVLPEHVVTATGATGANLTVFHSILSANDHVICQYPTYPQLVGLPESFPCELSYWRLDPENGWSLDREELRRLIKPSTKMIILNSPGNPTGELSRLSIGYLFAVDSDRIYQCIVLRPYRGTNMC